MSIDNVGKKSNKVEVGRRSFEDEEWQACKKVVRERDKGKCRFKSCLSVTEFYQIKPGTPANLDPAHVIPVSEDSKIMYNPRNVVTLTRFIHRRMDDYKSPLTGEDITKNEHYYWWWRILENKVACYDENVDYKALVLEYIYGRI